MRRNTQTPDPLATVLRYHTETKHDYDRFARSLGYLDWANQPDPFRRYRGSRLLPLPVLQPDETPVSPCYEAIYETAEVPVQPVSLRSLSRVLEYSLALTAWKQAGAARRAPRSTPSSGNLHPTEGYLYVGPVPEVTDIPRLYHYAPKEHALEERAESTEAVSSRLMRDFPPNAFLVGLSSVHWREAWKYGERAFRCCQHDVGHAVGAGGECQCQAFAFRRGFAPRYPGPDAIPRALDGIRAADDRQWVHSFIEAGSGEVLLGLVKRIDPVTNRFPLGTPQDFMAIEA